MLPNVTEDGGDERCERTWSRYVGRSVTVGVRSLNELNGEKDGVTGSGLVDGPIFSTSRTDRGGWADGPRADLAGRGVAKRYGRNGISGVWEVEGNEGN